MGAMAHEIRVALRRLARAPAFTLIAVLTLALGIGANGAIFSVVEAVLLRPLPYPEPDRLVMLWQDYSRRGGPDTEWFSPGSFLDWRSGNRSLEDMAVFADWQPTLTGAGSATRLAGGVVSRGFFHVLGVVPALGRTFTAAEDLPGADPVVLLSDATWRARFAADPGILGRTVQLDGEAQTVVGVLPPGFSFPLLADDQVFRPLRLDPADAPYGQIVLRAIGRLKPGVSLPQARHDLSAVAARLAERQPRELADVGANLTPLREQLTGDLEPALLALLAAVGAVLLIACVNLANLLLVRAEARGREQAVRRALGAGTWRLAAGALLESLLVAGAGAVAGLLVAEWSIGALRALAPIALPALFTPRLDGGVLLFAAGLAVASGLASGLLPALRGGRADDLTGRLREGSAGSGSSRRQGRTRGVLVATQMALAFTLLAGAGLLLRSFVALEGVDPGFDPRGVLSFRVAVPPTTYPEPAQAAALLDRYLERLRALPGVESASMISWLPMSGADTDVSFVVEGEPAPEPGHEHVIWYRQIDPDYFSSLRIRRLAGRTFTAADSADAPRVVVLGEAAARRFFPGEDAVGKRLKPGDDPSSDEPWWTVVGVVANVRHAGLDADPKLEMYLPEAQAPRRGMTIVLRTAGRPEDLVGPARAALTALDPALALAGVDTLSDMVSGSVAVPRFLTLCVLAFAAVALFLAALGVYGVVAQVVGRRSRELGLRMALGADRGAVLRLVMRQGMVPVAAGVAIGLLGALLAGRLIRGLLFQVPPTDAVTLAAVTGLLAAAALLATWLPGRRATRLDPLVALREE